MTGKTIDTALGKFSKEKFRALVNVRETALHGLREALKEAGYTEVTTSTLVNIAGSCENPHASFPVDYYGREAHLSQSAQIQLEALVIRLKSGFFTVNNSFREENYDDPEAAGRRLSEFTLVEPERPYKGMHPGKALDRIIEEQCRVVKHATKKVLDSHAADISLLGGNANYLCNTIDSPFQRISYENTLRILNRNSNRYRFGDDLGIKEEKKILVYFGNIPTFVTHYPASIKFFNMKRMPDRRKVYNVDLLMPRLGETSGGAVREENGARLKKQLVNSRIGKYISEKGQNPVAVFGEYLSLFKQERPLLRGGYGIGFERYVGFLLQSNDILATIAYRTLKP